MEPLPKDQARLTIDAILDRFRLIEVQRDAALREVAELREENAQLRRSLIAARGQTTMPIQIAPAVPESDGPPPHNID
jgi:hypothetical protein